MGGVVKRPSWLEQWSNLGAAIDNIVSWADSINAYGRAILVVKVLKSAHILSSTLNNQPHSHRSPPNPELKINIQFYRGLPGPPGSSTVASD